jgi:hypothetical protein
VVSFMPRPLYPQHPFDRRLGGHQSRSERCGEEKILANHVRWVPCHHGMARPQVADGGDSLQFWREAANILNKQ